MQALQRGDSNLADGGVTSQDVGIFVNRQLGRLAIANLQDGTPLGKANTVLVVLLAEIVFGMNSGLVVLVFNFEMMTHE
jgi:hypothetical protein